MRRAVWIDGRVYGNPVPGIDDPIGIPVRRCTWAFEPPCDFDLHAYRFFRIHGDLYVPWGDTYERTAFS